MKHLITYHDKNGVLRTTYAIQLKQIAGCIKFTAITPSGQKNGQLTMNLAKVKQIEEILE